MASLCVLALLFGFAQAQFDSSTLSNVTNAFSTAQIVPDVIPTFSPVDLLAVQFTDPSTMQGVNVTPGALLTMEQTSMEPQFTLLVDPNSNSSVVTNSFVLSIVDPDAPTPQNTSLSDFLHFLGGDFNPDPVTGLLTNSSAALMEFFPPGPPAGSDPHRYVVLLFNQPDTFDTTAPGLVNSTTPRNNFNLTTFAQSMGLGNPVAGNYFLVGPDGSSSTTTASAPSGPPTSATTPTNPNNTPTVPGSPSTSSVTTSAASINAIPCSFLILLVLPFLAWEV